MTSRPLVGVAVIVKKEGYVLLGKRKNSHGAGTWALPGGHLEFNESIADCAAREVFEETALHIKNVQHAAFTNDVFVEEQKHYVTLFVTAEYDCGNLDVKEPHKCERWAWFRWDELPSPLFLPLEHLITQGINVSFF